LSGTTRQCRTVASFVQKEILVTLAVVPAGLLTLTGDLETVSVTRSALHMVTAVLMPRLSMLLNRRRIIISSRAVNYVSMEQCI